MKKITELVTKTEKPEQRAKKKAIDAANDA
jgi:hypothetical protein